MSVLYDDVQTINSFFAKFANLHRCRNTIETINKDFLILPNPS